MLRKSDCIDFETGEVFVKPMDRAKIQPGVSPDDMNRMLGIFEAQVDVWQFGPAAGLLRLMEGHLATEYPEESIWRHSGYGLLSMLLSYFERVGKILNPKATPRKSSAKDFVIGFRDVYPQLTLSTREIGEFRDRARNGLYHLGLTKNRLWTHRDPQWPLDFAIVWDDATKAMHYLVNPHEVARTMIGHFPGLLTRLRDESNIDLRSQFRRYYKDFRIGNSDDQLGGNPQGDD